MAEPISNAEYGDLTPEARALIAEVLFDERNLDKLQKTINGVPLSTDHHSDFRMNYVAGWASERLRPIVGQIVEQLRADVPHGFDLGHTGEEAEFRQAIKLGLELAWIDVHWQRYGFWGMLHRARELGLVATKSTEGDKEEK